MRFVDRSALSEMFAGKTVAVVGSGPGCEKNKPKFVDSHDVVVRVNNFKCSPRTGYKTDVFYSYFGRAILKHPSELIRRGVKLCVAKCPNAKFMDSEFHIRYGKVGGTDFRFIYEFRKDWWFCDTYIPSTAEFMESFHLLGGRVPTTGFSAILAVLKHSPQSLYLTGFDFFTSGIHNVNQRWKPGDPRDPIGHDPAAERQWLRENVGNYPITMDPSMASAMASDEGPKDLRLNTYRIRQRRAYAVR